MAHRVSLAMPRLISEVSSACDTSEKVVDRLSRPLRDLRISVTDRCNFRCVYCMPKHVFGRDYPFLPREELLTFAEIARIARIAVSCGVEKIRLTGGEPLLRQGLEELITLLAALKTTTGGPLDIAVTTNGSALAAKAQSLKDAGLRRITVSLDSLDDQTFHRMNDVNFPVASVLRGLDAAHRAGLGPIKVNTVIKKGQNDQEIVALARYFKNSPYQLRFIEYMDVGTTNAWRLDEVVPSQEIIRRINAVFPLERIDALHPGETSTRWRYRDGSGEIGVISSVTEPFCSHCSRARISTEGKLFTCLFAEDGYDLRALLRSGCSDEQLFAVISGLWRSREDRYSEVRHSLTPAALQGRKKIEMSYIGG